MMTAKNKHSTISRRQFVGLGSAAAAATAAFLSGCGSAEAPATGGEEAQTGLTGGTSGATNSSGIGLTGWIGTDPEIAGADIVETISTDVVVVGCGIAGSVAAAAALDSGAKVTVLDKGIINHIGGPACSMLNSKFQLDQNFDEYDPTQMLYELVRQSNFTANTALLALWTFHSGEILDWLIETVIKPDPTAGGQLEKPVYVTAFKEQSPDPEICLFRNTGVYFGTQDVPSNMGDWITLLHYFITNHGGSIRFQMKVVKILQDNAGAVVGVIAEDADGKYTQYNASKGVIMASGSFGSNTEMRNSFLKPKIANMFATHNIGEVFMPEPPAEPLDNGEGHQMMCRIGAAMEQYPNPHNEYAQGTIMGVPFLAVNNAGLRFVNEAQSMLCYADLLCEQPGDEMTYWAIIPDDYAASGLSSTNVAVDEAGNIVNPFSDAQYQMLQDGPKADSVEELAKLISIDPNTLVATVERYNKLCDTGLDEDFGKLAKYMKPIKTGPFYADQQVMSCCVTMGGVRCSGKLEVLGLDGLPIPGLYAAGNTVGQRFGAGYEGSFGGMTNAYGTVHGYFAGRNVAAR
jgi:succinate dehydrogenase/fumarate reductase flavoprotein subunit